jgi:threonine/homoserine/homoserine lactone efflux protein
MEDPILFTFAAVTLIGAPGPTNALLAAGGAASGFRRSLHLLLAALSAYLIAILTLEKVIASLLPENGRWALTLLAGVYLTILAARLWRARPEKRAASIRWHRGGAARAG